MLCMHYLILKTVMLSNRSEPSHNTDRVVVAASVYSLPKAFEFMAEERLELRTS